MAKFKTYLLELTPEEAQDLVMLHAVTENSNSRLYVTVEAIAEALLEGDPTLADDQAARWRAIGKPLYNLDDKE